MAMKIKKQAQRVIALLVQLCFEPSQIDLIASMVGLTIVLLLGQIINRVAFTEIDWKTYMQQVSLYQAGERDYAKIKGDTGPIVYPAGFLYVFSLLRRITSAGTDLRLAQYVFAGIFQFNFVLAWLVYRACEAPPLLLCFLALSKRAYSIYVLRLFNDPVAVLPTWCALTALVHDQWLIATIFFNLALSIKMNAMLYLPAFGILLYRRNGLRRSLLHIFLSILLQTVIAIPFLDSHDHAFAYFDRAFDFRRSFLYKWTVNWRFVPEQVFLSQQFSTLLLQGHLVALLLFTSKSWCREGLIPFLRKYRVGQSDRDPPIRQSIIMLLTSNLIGMTFARSLHYQFFSWYTHGLPLLAWTASGGVQARTTGAKSLCLAKTVIILGLIELSWDTYPSTPFSSTLLLTMHLTLLAGLYLQ